MKFWSLLREHEETYLQDNALKVGVVGSRKWEDTGKMINVFETLSEKPMDICIVSGGCPSGADFMAKELASYHNMPYKEFTPQFKERNEHTAQPDYMEFDKNYETYYYFKRNRELAEYVDLLLAFIPKELLEQKDGSKGTKHTVKEAKKRNKKTIVLH